MKIALVCSQGGHLTDMMELIEAIEGNKFFFATYSCSREKELRQIAPVYTTPYSGVGPVSVLRYTLWALRIILREKPDLILSTGAEIAIPFFYIGKLMRIRRVYVECFCNVETLSKTARIVYPVTDEFLVQWPELLEKCGKKARYEGGVL
jgi:beta-1,4-N-acetylglucosaminyltransferase